MVTSRQLQRVALVMVLALACVGAARCPSEDDLTRAAKASSELAHDLVLANKAVAELFKADRISLARKDQWAAKLELIGSKGETLNNTLVELDKKYPQGTMPPQDLQFLKDNFAELKALFTTLFADLQLLNMEDAVKELSKDIKTISKVADQ